MCLRKNRFLQAIRYGISVGCSLHHTMLLFQKKTISACSTLSQEIYLNTQVLNIVKLLVISPKNRTVWNFRGELIKDIISSGNEVLVTGPDLEGVERIQSLGARFELVPLKKNGLNVLDDIKYTWLLWRLMRKEKPDATLGYTIKPE